MSQSSSSSPNGSQRTKFQVRRDGELDLAFTGVLLGEGETTVDVLDKIKNLWTERGHTCRIYRTSPPSNRYVIEFISWSGISTERDRHNAVTCASPDEVRLELPKLTGKGIPDAAKRALENAAASDDALSSIAVVDMDDPESWTPTRNAAVVGPATVESMTSQTESSVDQIREQLRLEDEFKSVDEIGDALRVARDACQRVGGGLMGPDDTPAKRVAAAHNAMCAVEDVVDRVARRLPRGLQPEARDVAHSARLLTSRTASGLASRPPEVNAVMGEVVEFGNRLARACAIVEDHRAQILGYA